MTDFSVRSYDGDVTHYSGEAARYEINPHNGVLTVFDDHGKRLHFSPAGWMSVRDAAPISVYEKHAAKTT